MPDTGHVQNEEKKTFFYVNHFSVHLNAIRRILVILFEFRFTVLVVVVAAVKEWLTSLSPIRRFDRLTHPSAATTVIHVYAVRAS